MHKSGYSIAVVGATGLVGTEVLATLEQRCFPISDLQLYSSIRSAGGELACGDIRAPVDLLERARFEGTDVAFFAAGEQVSAEWLERATAAGAVVIDTSPLWATDPDVPLVVPEVNGADVSGHTTRGIVACPDAPAIALAVALKPLADAAGLVRVVCSTFEPVCGAGRAGIEELQRQTIELMNGRSTDNEVFPHRIAFNLLPQVGEFLAGGRSRNEVHIVTSVRRLLADPVLPLSVTCTRVPLFYGEALAVNVETARKLSAAEAREILRAAPGVWLHDEPGAGVYPTAAEAVGQDATLIGRVREDEGLNVLDLWVAIDNLRKGAAVNAVQIAEVLVRDYL